MSDTLNRSAVALSEGVVSLYPELANGQADYAAPVWLGGTVQGGGFETAQARRLRRVTGRATPRGIQGALSHTLSFERLWVVAGPAGWAPVRGRHVLELTWRDAVSRRWHRSRFLGVTMDGGRWSADGLYAFLQGQSFTAEQHVPLEGSGLLPEEAGVLDVWWFGEGGESEILYRYAGGAFAEVNPGRADSRALITANGSSVTAADEVPWLESRVTGLAVRGRRGPVPPVTPRLEFRAGDRWLGTLSWWGFTVNSSATVAGPIALPGDGFAFRSGATVAGTLRPGAPNLQALGYPAL